MRLSSRRRVRKGTVLITYAALFFGLLGLAAVVIDLGYARLAQSQMQSVVDAAALEGMRNGTDGDADSTTARDAASGLVALAFDDDLDPANGDPMQFGAGPVFDLSGGVGPPELAAGQRLGVDRSARVYKPRRANGTPGLELNVANAPHGDIVAGNYARPQNQTGRDENSDFSRNDGFAPVAVGARADSLLVRIRRSNDLARSDLGPADGVFTSGPPLPFLFGRGTLVQSNANGYNPRHDGITARATAIAQAVPVKTVGLAARIANPNDPTDVTDIRGLPAAALAIRWDYWALPTTDYPSPYWQTIGTPDQPPTDRPKTLQLQGGSITVTAGSRPTDWPADRIDLNIVGRVIDATTKARWNVGEPVGGPTTAQPVVGDGVYTLLYETIGGIDYVVGVGLFDVAVGPDATLTLIRRSDDLGKLPPRTHRNVSVAVLQRPETVLPDSTTLNALFARNASFRTMTDAAGKPIAALAPVLVR